jgi:hypothetical protein
MHYSPLAVQMPPRKVLPVMDGDFDDFELNTDMETQLKESEIANFYHNAYDSEE